MRYIFIVLGVLLCLNFTFAKDINETQGAQRLFKPLTEENYPIKSHHKELNFQCATCHGDGPKEEYKKLSTKDCLSCHQSFDKLAEQSGDLGYDDNVHASPHYPKMDCNLCHSSHQSTKNYCVMCHSQDSMKNLLVP